MDKLNSLLQDLDLILSENQLKQFETYYNLLIEKNKVMNLTAITEKDDVIVKHFLDSLLIYRIPEFKNVLSSPGARIIDVGTGAGFPGIPLKIAFPDLEIVLLDSLNKRVRFLDEVIGALSLKKITALHGRAEEAAHNTGLSYSTGEKVTFKDNSAPGSLRDGFDIVTSRAVANLSILSEYSLPFAKKGGYFIPYKASKIDDELNDSKKALGILGGKLIRNDKIILPGTEIERSFIIIRKEKATPKAYPRKAGDIKKKPMA